MNYYLSDLTKTIRNISNCLSKPIVSYAGKNLEGPFNYETNGVCSSQKNRMLHEFMRHSIFFRSIPNGNYEVISMILVWVRIEPFQKIEKY